MMTSPLKPWIGFGLFLSSAALGGCAMAQAQRPTAESAPPQEQVSPKSSIELSQARTDAETLLGQVPLGRPNRPISAANITSVKVFNLDSQCDRFEGEVVTLTEDGSLEEAVGLAIANSNNPDFSISSYRVGEGRFAQEVVVDLRLAPDSKRVFQSLSICEGQALFGSIRRTLVENGQFDVTQVQFTTAGEELVL